MFTSSFRRKKLCFTRFNAFHGTEEVVFLARISFYSLDVSICQVHDLWFTKCIVDAAKVLVCYNSFYIHKTFSFVCKIAHSVSF